ncbi:MAG: hypothetical protein ACK5PP_04760, partial [Acidimicrobiales bacterium]
MTIDRVRAVHRVTPGAEHLRAELDDALRSALVNHLPVALERAGLRSAAVVCIGSLRVGLRTDPGMSTDDLGRAWSEQIAASVATGDDDIRRYPSIGAVRAAALERARAGDLEDLWAWRQAGVVPGSAVDGAAVVAAVLDAEPQAVVPLVAAELADGGPHRAAGTVREVGTDVVVRALRRTLVRADATTSLRELLEAASGSRGPELTRMVLALADTLDRDPGAARRAG